MLTGEVAKYQIQDRIRAAEMDRVSKAAMGNRGGRSRVAVRKVGSGILAAVASLRSNTGATTVPRTVPRVKTA
jgi:hypothetical protein